MEPIAAIIILYNPEIKRLRKNIDSIAHQTHKIFLVDNGSKNIDDVKVLLDQNTYSYILIQNNKNLGIAAALNIGFSEIEKSGYKWAITMDQDSISPDKLVAYLSKSIGEEIGIVCPLIKDINKKNNVPLSNKVISVSQCITSGSLTNVMAWKKVNGFDEKLFIDGVDFDFCYRLRQNGYKILENHHIALTHEIGRIKKHNILGIRIYVKNHSAFRKYYIAKNIIYLDRKQRKMGFPFFSLLREMKQLMLILFFEADKLNKTKAVLKGTADGFFEKYPKNKM